MAHGITELSDVQPFRVAGFVKDLRFPASLGVQPIWVMSGQLRSCMAYRFNVAKPRQPGSAPLLPPDSCSSRRVAADIQWMLRCKGFP